MNQVMINSVELDTLMSEIKYLKSKVAELQRLLGEQRHQVVLLERELNEQEGVYRRADS